MLFNMRNIDAYDRWFRTGKLQVPNRLGELSTTRLGLTIVSN